MPRVPTEIHREPKFGSESTGSETPPVLHRNIHAVYYHLYLIVDIPVVVNPGIISPEMPKLVRTSMSAVITTVGATRSVRTPSARTFALVVLAM